MATAGNRPSGKISKMKYMCGRKNPIAVQSLLSLSVSAVVSNIDELINAVKDIPSGVKSEVLHLMSKRSNLITDENISYLATEWTKELDFTSSEVSDDGILSLPSLPYLYKLDLNDTRTGTRDNVTSAALKHVADRCPNLRILYLRRCINIDDEGIIALSEKCKRLEEINLSGCPKITDRSVKAIAQNCSNLLHLNLAYTSISDESAVQLAQGVCAKKLQEVHVSYCKHVTDVGVEALLYGSSNITYMEIQGCPQVTEKSLDALDQLRERYDLKQFNFTIPF